MSHDYITAMVQNTSSWSVTDLMRLFARSVEFAGLCLKNDLEVSFTGLRLYDEMPPPRIITGYVEFFVPSESCATDLETLAAGGPVLAPVQVDRLIQDVWRVVRYGFRSDGSRYFEIVDTQRLASFRASLRSSRKDADKYPAECRRHYGTIVRARACGSVEKILSGTLSDEEAIDLQTTSPSPVRVGVFRRA